MRRFTSIFAILLTMMIGSSVSAQAQDVLEELQGKGYKVGEVVSDIVPGQWYIMNQPRTTNNAYSRPLEEGYLFDAGVGNQLLKGMTEFVDVKGINICDSNAQYIVRFKEATSSDPGCMYDTYTLQFGTGNWVGTETFNSKIQPATTDNEYLATPWNCGHFPGEGDERSFWFTLDYNQQHVDNNSFGDTWYTTVVHWGSGDPTTFVRDRNYDWFLSEVTIVDNITEIDVKRSEVYQRWAWLTFKSKAMVPGTEHGQYEETAYENFINALNDAAEKLEDDSYEWTEKKIQETLDDINGRYEAVEAAKIIKEFKPANGYYYIEAAGYNYHEKVITEESEEYIYPAKGLYSNVNGLGWKTLDHDNPDASFLWRIDLDEETGNYQLYNCATGGRFEKIVRSTVATFNTEIDPVSSEIAIEFINVMPDGDVAFAFHLANQDPSAPEANSDCIYAHQSGHSLGEGKSGNIVGWNKKENSGEGSWWKTVAVDDAKALELIQAYADVMNHDKLVNTYDSLLKIANNKILVAEGREKIATSVDQLYSEYTDPSEGSLAGAIDNNYNTFWHSDWHNGNVEPGSHYLQIDALKEISKGAMIYFVRRTGSGRDMTTRFSLYGSVTGEEATKEEWTELGEWENNNMSQNTAFISDPIKFEGSYRYFRIYSEETKTSEGKNDNRGYWHAAELNILPFELAPNSQAIQMGDTYTNLRNFLDEHKNIESKDINSAIVNQFKEYLSAFEAKLVDPNALKNAIADARKKTENVVIGTDPGYWPDDSFVAEINKLADEAEEYNNSGKYTQEQTDAYLNALKEKSAGILGAANKVRTDKWYQIQFPDEELYDERGWDKSPAVEVLNSGFISQNALWNRVIAVGKQIEGDGVTYHSGAKFATQIGVDEAYQGSKLVLDIAEDLFDEDLSYFRFVETDVEGEYLLQNKANGLFVKTGVKNTISTTDVHPSIFKVEAVGCGTNIFRIKDVDETNYGFLNCSRNGGVIISWSSGYVGSNSAYLIKEAGDITTLPENTYLMQAEEGRIYPFTSAVSYKVISGDVDASLFTFNGITENDEYVFTPVNEAQAGVPTFMVVEGEYYEPFDDEEPEYVEITLEHGMNFVRKEVNTDAVVGSFKATNAPKGAVVVDKATLKVLKSSTELAVNSAYINPKQAPIVEGDRGFIIEIGGTGEIVSVQDVLQKVATSGTIYGIDGRVILEKGNINSINKLGKGVYILNGAKIMVK